MTTKQKKQIREILKSIFPIRENKEIIFKSENKRLFVVFPMNWLNINRIKELNKKLGIIAIFPTNNKFKYTFNIKEVLN